MSKYTTTFRRFCENQWQLDGHQLEGSTTDQHIKNALPYIFNFDFPIWEEEYRETLEELIVSHYYIEEIAFETWGQFILYLKNKLRERMPYYNFLYNKGKTMGDIFLIGGNEKVHTVRDNLHVTDNTGTQNNAGTSKNTGSETDQGTVKNTGTEKNQGTVDNTGTQGNVGERKNTGTQGTTGHQGDDTWTADSNVAVGADYKNVDQVSKAQHVTNDTDTTSTRTDDLKEDISNTRTDNLKRTDDFTRTDDLIRTDDLTHGVDLLREDDFTRTDNLTETDKIDDDEWVTRDKNQEVADKVGVYRKLWEYYRNIDEMIIRDLECLFIGIW